MRTISEVERGAVLVMVAVCMSLFFILLAVAMDIGYMHATKAELQHAADSAAMAGALDLAEPTPDPVGLAQDFGGYNAAAKVALTDLPAGDVTVGYMENPLDIHAEIDTASTEEPNSVEVITRREVGINGPLQLFLGPFTGLNEVDIATKGRAVWTRQVIFYPDEPPGGGEPVLSNLIPFSISKTYWEDPAKWTNNKYLYVEEGVVQGPGTYNDEPESDVYPIDTTAGNFGTVDIGNHNNAVPDIRDQIVYGVTATDFQESFPTGVPGAELNADTGISAGFEAALISIIGKPKMMLIHTLVTKQGNTSYYTIERQECVVIMAVNLHKNPKYLYIQKCDGCCQPGGSGGTGTPHFEPEIPPSDTLYMTGLTR